MNNCDIIYYFDACLPRELELALFRALRSEGGQHAAIDVEYLHTVVVAIGHDDAVGAGHGDVVRVLQLSGLVPERPELAYERAV